MGRSEFLDSGPLQRADPSGLIPRISLLLGIEGDLVGIFGIEVGIGTYIEFGGSPLPEVGDYVTGGVVGVETLVLEQVRP